MSLSRRQLLKAAGWCAAGIAVTNIKDVGTDTSVADAAGTPLPSQSTWTERILNNDGTINWTEYVNVANNYNKPEIINYRFGPDYAYYNPTPETIPQLWGATSNGFLGNSDPISTRSHSGVTDWFAMSGQLVFSPDASAPAEYQPGVARSRNGSIYLFEGATPDYCYDMRVQWTPDNSNYYNTIPDVAVTQESWKQASRGSVSAPPIATVRTKGQGGVTGFLIFQNGFIGATGTGNDGYVGCCSNPLPYPFVQLPAGKVPTAAAVTPSNEFLLVTVWDTINQKGQVAVIAIQGRVVANEKTFLWGFPSWPTIKGMKILGYITLPFAAPTAIQTSVDHVSNSGRGHNDNENFDLNSQTERDSWYNWSGSWYKRSARCGYTVVLSRAENKAAFIDLQPLLSYYRKMYFTTQENYEQTKNEGNARNQWPHTFSYAPEQRPRVISNITVKQPTAVATGLPWCTFYWRDHADTFKENAYIATMSGELRMYKVGNLMTTEAATPIGQPFKIVQVGKNPTNIDYGFGANLGNDLFVNCRGNKTVYYLYHDGKIQGSLRDARLQDPVYVTVSFNGRGKYNCPLLSIMDFNGRQVVNYRYQNGIDESLRIPVGNPANSSVFEYGYATSLPGKPFMFTLTEVI